MNTYDRLFGSGPRGIGFSLSLFALAWRLESSLGWPTIVDSDVVRWTVFTASIMAAAALAAWAFKSLPTASRGVILVTSGPYKYMRHPLYAALLSSFNWGLSVLLNNWIYLAWAVALHGVWHWNIQSEEKQMNQAFPAEYPDYCRTTGRFFPRIRIPLSVP